MYTTLLWATDGSPEADLAQCEALELLAPAGRLVAFHCDQRFMGNRSGGAPVIADETDRRRHIERQVERLQAAGIDAEMYVETTSRATPRQIAAVAEQVAADAIVCGTRGLGGFFGLLTGSVAADLLRRATVPVIVVPAKSARPQAGRPRVEPRRVHRVSMMDTTTPSDALAADVLRDEEGFIRIEIDVPGLQPTVDVHTHDHIVVVDGHRASARPGHYLLHERPQAFHREFHLPRETDMLNVHARIHDGVLTISAPAGGGGSEPGEHRVEVRPSSWACHPDAAAI